MTAEQLVKNWLEEKVPEIKWGRRVPEPVAVIAREMINDYFVNCSKYNTPSVFVRYQLERDARGFWNKLLDKNPVIEDWVFQGNNEKEIQVTPFAFRGRTIDKSLEKYLQGAQAVYLTFMYGTHQNGNKVIEQNSNSTRIGEV